MRKSMSRFFVCLLAAALLCTQLTVGVFAAPPGRTAAGQAAAEELYELGLFLGSGTLPNGSPNFDLDRTPYRGEAVVMLVRLLGAEEEAKSGQFSHSFTDAAEWADAHIGYAYTNGITNGVSTTKFGTYSSIDLPQFLTFVLRALGYNDVDWRNPYPTADAVGLYYPDGDGFYRADIALICLDALDCQLKGQDMTLRTKLINSGAIDEKPGNQFPGVFVPGPVAPLVTQITVSSPDEFITQLAIATLGHAEKITVYVPNGQTANYVQALGDTLYDLSSPFSEVSGYTISFNSSNTIWVTPAYSDAVRIMAWLEGRAGSLSDQDAEVLSAAQAIHNALVTPGMSEYEQVKAFHNYLVNNTEFRETGERSHSAAGPLLDGFAVCEGYSKALDILCYLSGIECVCINGTGNGGSHGWNKVKIDGQWYNIDVTWDDPISSRPILTYDYFLVSDSVLAQDHAWIPYSFWPVAPASYSR